MSNVIVNRVAEFLKRFPPFSFLGDGDLTRVAQSVAVQYLEQGEILFQQGEAARPHFFILKEGIIHLVETSQKGEEIREVCDEGDVFGVLALLGKRPYLLTSKVIENSLIYAIPVAVFEKILEENSRVALFFAAGFAAGQVVVRQDLSQGQKARSELKKASGDHSLLIFSDQSAVNFSEKVLNCPPETSIQSAAKLMAEAQVSSIVICDSQDFPLGILTDKDLRSRVLASEISPQNSVSQVMTSPVITRKKQDGFSNLYLTMIRHRLHHLVLTGDGTDQSPVCGIISDHDVFLSMGNSPAVLIHALLNTQNVGEMRQIRDRAEQMLCYYLENEVSMEFVASVMTEINDVIIGQALEIAKANLETRFPEMTSVRFCFLSMGSEGREEQLLRTDLDNAILYEDVAEELQTKAAEYFLRLGEGVVEVLLACGFDPCPGKIMASNPEWVQPLSVWKNYFSDWILHPSPEALMKVSIFFDFRSVAGSNALAAELSDHIYQEIGKKQIFLNFLAQNAMKNPPPLGFFRDFVVEKSGENRDQFDIKLRAMLPLTDLARLLVLSHQIVGINNTFQRFEKLAKLESSNSELYSQAGKAYEILMRMRALEGLQNRNNGRYLNPKSLGKLQRQLLKNAFAPIAELQEIVNIRFQLDYFRR
jgi:CBS domain-containing protein